MEMLKFVENDTNLPGVARLVIDGSEKVVTILDFISKAADVKVGQDVLKEVAPDLMAAMETTQELRSSKV